MSALFLEQKFADGPQLLNVVLWDPPSNIDRSSDGRHPLQLGDLIAIPNLIDDDPIGRCLLSNMEKRKANANGTITQGGNKNGNPVFRGCLEDRSLIFDACLPKPPSIVLKKRSSPLTLLELLKEGESPD